MNRQTAAVVAACAVLVTCRQPAPVAPHSEGRARLLSLDCRPSGGGSQRAINFLLSALHIKQRIEGRGGIESPPVILDSKGWYSPALQRCRSMSRAGTTSLRKPSDAARRDDRERDFTMARPQ